MSYHRNNKNRNAENASYIHVQRDAIRTVSLSAPPRSRPTHGSYNKVDVNKEPKFNLCPGKALSLCDLLTSVVCIPMELSDGPNNLHCYPPPSSDSRPSPHQVVLENWWEDFFHEQECTWFKGYVRKCVGCRLLDIEPP